MVSCSGLQKPEMGSIDNTPIDSTNYQQNTPSFTLQSTVKATQTVTKTRRISTTPSFTPMPTLNKVVAQKTLSFMVYQNGGCKLPCWWGITPGETKYEEMIQVISPLVKGIENIEYDTAKGKGVISMPYFNEDEKAYEGGFAFYSIDGIVQGVEVLQDFAKRYTLASLLSNYGEPEEIYLATYSEGPFYSVPYSLILYYPTKGILAHYPSNYGTISGSYIIICPQNIIPFLNLWPSGIPQEAEEVMMSIMYHTDFRNYKKIELATDFNTKKFYSVFSQRNGTQCITSRAEKWEETVETFVPYFPTNTITPTPLNPYLETTNPNLNIETVIPTP